MVQVYIGLGSNLGDRSQTLRQAISALSSLAHDGEVLASRFFATRPVGGPPQPTFLNAVAGFQTFLSPRALLASLQRIEGIHGRLRLVANGPRTLDLDLLWYGGHRVDQPQLQVPHPRMGERRFVLEPLAQLAPQLPLERDTVHNLLQCLAPSSDS